MPSKHLISSIILSLVIRLSAAAQGPALQDAANTDEKQQARVELEKKALALLDEVITEAPTLKSENRIRIQARAAELLWPRDSQRARALFVESMNMLSEMMSSLDNSDPEYHSQILGPSQLRHEMLQIVSRYDIQLAYDFLRATREPLPPQTDPFYKTPDNEAQMEMQLALQLADKDPKRALNIATELLKKEVSYPLSNLVYQLRTKDGEAAEKLANEIIRKLRSENLAKNPAASSVAFSLLQMARQPETARWHSTVGSGPQVGPTPAKDISPVLNEQAYRELLDTVVTSALSASGGGNSMDYRQREGARSLFMGLQSLMPEIEKWVPSRASALQRKMAEFETGLDPQQRAWSALNKLERNATPHDLLEAGSKVPLGMRNPYYQQAAWKSMRQGDMDLARQIVTDYISNPMERKQMLANFDREMLIRSAQQGKLEEARQLLAHLRSDEERATALTQLATTTAAKGDKKTALQILDEAHSLVNRQPENHAQLSAQLQVANAYAGLNPDRGFQILEPIVDLLNELVSAAAVLQGFDHSGSFKDGELVQVGGGMVPSMIQQCTGTLGVLASANLDRAKAVADRFQRNETRLSARLAAVQAVLSPQRAPGGFQRLPGRYVGGIVTR